MSGNNVYVRSVKAGLTAFLATDGRRVRYYAYAVQPGDVAPDAGTQRQFHFDDNGTGYAEAAVVKIGDTSDTGSVSMSDPIFDDTRVPNVYPGSGNGVHVVGIAMTTYVVTADWTFAMRELAARNVA